MDDDIIGGLGAARARIEATRRALLAARDKAPIRRAIARLDRMVAELERIEGVVAGQAAGARE